MTDRKNDGSDRKREEILGIRNRTENWKTARHLSPFFGERAIHLAKKLEEGYSEKSKCTDSSKVILELYWKGMRDYAHRELKCNKLPKEVMEDSCAMYYKSFFGKLQEYVRSFDGLNPLRKSCNYAYTNIDKSKLFNNLRNTEIDIVLETPDKLFIGEAKGESDFGANGELILVHQLIRQYVMATILVQGFFKCSNKKIVPFVVGDCKENLVRKSQIRFMMKHYHLKCKNILSWKELHCLAQEKC